MHPIERTRRLDHADMDIGSRATQEQFADAAKDGGN